MIIQIKKLIVVIKAVEEKFTLMRILKQKMVNSYQLTKILDDLITVKKSNTKRKFRNAYLKLR